MFTLKLYYLGYLKQALIGTCNFMMKTAMNTQDSGINPVVLQVLGILGIKKDTFKTIGDNYKRDIDAIMEKTPKAKENKELALYLINEVDVGFFHKISPKLREDKAIALAALRKDSNIFFSLPGKYKLQIDFAQEAIKSLVRERTSFIEVEKFLTQHFPEMKIFGKLLKFYKNYLKTAEYIFQSDVERQLINIREMSPDVYTLIFEKKLLETQGKNIKISQNFTKKFLEEIGNISGYSELPIQEQQEKKIEIFIKYLGLTNTDLPEEMQVFFATLTDLLHIKQEKKQIEEENSVDKKKDTQGQEETRDDEDDFEDRFDFCVPHCSYVHLSEGGCDIAVGHNVHMSLSEDEMNKISNAALKNYVSGMQKLTELGLGFSLYHQNKFFSLCGVDHIYGEGLSEAKVLKILNKVGKNIGVPEKNFSKNNENEEEKKEVGCFRSIEDAVFQFRRIRDTGKIQEADEYPLVEVSKKGNKSILQHIFEHKGLFDTQGGAFMHSQWI